MPLPLLSTTSHDLLRHFLRCDLHRVRHLIESETQLDPGTALTNPALPTVHDANHVRDAALPSGLSPEQAVARVNAHFTAAGTRCAYYVLNPSHPDAQTAPLRDHLLATGGILAVGDLGLIADLYVTPSHRRQGLAKILLSRLLEIAARSLFKHVLLDVAPTNTSAQHLYNNAGFAKVATHTLYRAPWTKP